LCASPEWAEHLRLDVLSPLLADVELGAQMIEVGPGPGASTQWLRHRVGRLVAAEADPAAAAALAERFADTNVEVVPVDAATLPFADGAFDAAGAFTMLHHIPTREQQQRVLVELVRVLRPGGLLVGSDSLTSEDLRRFHQGDIYNPLPPGRLLAWLHELGCQPITVTVNERLTFLAYKARGRKLDMTDPLGDLAAAPTLDPPVKDSRLPALPAGEQEPLLPIWEDVLPNVPDEQAAAAPGRVAAALTPMPDRTAAPAVLARRLGTSDAVLIGLGSMIGAGVFAAFGPAAKAAGSGLLIGLGIAAGLAYCNAVASAQLAAVYPTSGGTYIYGRERLGPWWGFAAGWGFVIGKTASCAAMALTVAAYALPGPVWAQRVVAAGAVLALSAVNYRGITRTVQLTRILVGLTLLALAVVVTASLAGGTVSLAHLGGAAGLFSGGVYGILQAAGLLFFAFAGYARIATLGEEVRDPARTIPRAIPLALFLTIGVYLLVAVAALLSAGPAGLAHAGAPLAAAVGAGGWSGVAPVVRVGGVLASAGALLALIAGIGRTSLAMARHHDLPGWLAAVHPRYQVPQHAEVALAGIVIALVLAVDLRSVIGFSSFGVLVYYAVPTPPPAPSPPGNDAGPVP